MTILFPQDPFQIEYGQTTLYIQPISLPGYVAFRVNFSSERPPLIVARAMNFTAGKFWTSIPEGRQLEAEGVGKLIEQFQQQKN